MTTLPALMNGGPICVAEKTHEGGRASLRFGLGECQCGFRQNLRAGNAAGGADAFRRGTGKTSVPNLYTQRSG